MDFEESEQCFFKHNCIHGGKSGEVVVTNIRIAFVCNDSSSDNKSLTWANVVSTKYSPITDKKGRAMILIKTAMEGEGDVIFQLVADTKEAAFAQLEHLKLVVNQQKKATPSTVSTTPIAKKVTKVAVDENDKVKQLILDSNTFLAKQYHNLVETSKIITDADFWKSHSDVLQEYSIHSNSNTLVSGDKTRKQNISGVQKLVTLSQNKGKSNSLLEDVMVRNSNGQIDVKLTEEKRANIFALRPDVKRAFEAEVPIRRSEVEFWKLYFQSEMFNSDIANTEAYSSHDDIISRYAQSSDMSLINLTTADGIAGSTNNKLTTVVNSDVDLTTTYGDYHSIDTTTTNTADQMVGSVFTKLASKYNKNGVLIVNGINNPQCSAMENETLIQTEKGQELCELTNMKQSEYVPINLHDTVGKHNQQLNTAVAVAEDTIHSDNTDIHMTTDSGKSSVSAFGTSTTAAAARHKRTFATFEDTTSHQQIEDSNNAFGKAARPAQASTLTSSHPTTSALSSSSNSTAIPIKSPAELVSTLVSIFPPRSRGSQVLTNEMKHMRQFSGHTTSSSSTNVIGLSNVHDIHTQSATVVDLTESNNLYGKKFEQDMLEAFTDITELLRHFYHILNRKGDSAPLKGNASANKAQGIIMKLQNENTKQLEHKKRQIQSVMTSENSKQQSAFRLASTTPNTINQKPSSPSTDYEGSLFIIDECLALIHRAISTWNVFNASI